MRAKILFTAASILLASTSVSFAACNIADKNIEGELSKVEGIRTGTYGALRRDVRELRSAAMVLDRYGKDDACQAVVTAMTDLLKDPKASSELGNKQGTGTGDGSTTTTETTQPAGSTTMEERRKTSVSFSDRKGAMSASELIGSDVYGTDNDSIGEIEDIVVTKSNEPAYALVSYGGFLGMGENYAAVPLSKLMISEDRYVFANFTAEQLQQAPAISRGDKDWWTNDEWRKKNDAFYQ
jgi:hypothetical protein